VSVDTAIVLDLDRRL